MKVFETIRNNTIIADFVMPSIEWNDSRKGKIRLYAKPGHNTPHCEDYELEYDEDWNWLMEVVHLIYLRLQDNALHDKLKKPWDMLTWSLSTTQKDCIYTAVLHFINEYNKVKP